MPQQETSPAPEQQRRREENREPSIYQRLWPYLKPHRSKIILGLILLIVSIPAGNFHPIAWKYIVDDVIGNRRVEWLLPLVGLMFAVQAVGSVLGAVRSNLLEKVGQQMVF